MLYSRAGTYPRGQPLLYAESFSPNTAQGACPSCHGLGRRYDVTEASMVRDDSLTIRERAIAAWPMAWQGQNLRDILTTLGYDVDRPWRELPSKDRDWIRRADWVVDVGPGAGQHGGEVVYSGPLAGLARASASETRRYVLDIDRPSPKRRRSGPLLRSHVARGRWRAPAGWATSRPPYA